MNWAEILAILTPTMGSVFLFYQIVKEDIRRMDERWQTSDQRHREDIQRMDEKWERLFEKLADRKL